MVANEVEPNVEYTRGLQFSSQINCQYVKKKQAPYPDLGFHINTDALWVKFSAADNLKYLSYFPQKTDLTFHADCLQFG